MKGRFLPNVQTEKQKQSGGHLDLTVAVSLLPLAPHIYEHFTTHKYVVTSSLSATQMLPLGQKGMVV